MADREELVRQAAELVPVLLALAPQVENQRSIPQETVNKLIDTGLLRAINPTRFGGMETFITGTREVISDETE